MNKGYFSRQGASIDKIIIDSKKFIYFFNNITVTKVTLFYAMLRCDRWCYGITGVLWVLQNTLNR